LINVNHDSYDDDYIRSVLAMTRTVAIVGASANEVRPSFFVAKYLASKGFRIFPVNPGHAGRPIAGAMTYATLADIPEPVDMVDIFRNSQAAGPVVDEALALETPPKVIWMQLGVRNDEAAAKAEEKGVLVVMNRCPKIEYARLCGEIGWAGVSSGVISARKPVLQAGFQRFGIVAPKDGK
jgi:predicted CoA-binding protein